MRLLIAIALLLAVPAQAAEVSNRTSLSLLGGGSTGHGWFEGMLSERLRVRWIDGDLKGQFHFDGRVGIRAPDGTLDRTRIRALGVRLEFERVWFDLGRFRVEGGSWRIADGAQGMVRLGKGVEIGGWFGEVPDPFTTLPAPRIGGGPSFRWLHSKAQVHAALELAGTATGLDRAALIVSGRVEPVENVEVSGRVDLQDLAGTPHPADVGVTLTLDPQDDVRIRVAYNTWSGLAFNQGHARDVALSRFAQRFGQAIPLDATAVDASLYHQAAGMIRVRPDLPTGARFVLQGDGRFRGHDDPDRHYARGTIRVGFERIGGRFDITTDHSVVYWNSAPRWDGGLTLRVEPVKDVFGLDASGRVAIGDNDPALYADLFADLRVGPVWLSAGYRFTNELARDEWWSAHVGLLRVTWVLRRKGQR